MSDALQLLKHRQDSLDALAGPHALRHKGDGLCVLHTKSAEVDAAGVDTKKLLVPCTITTQDEDRERDIVVTAGIDTTYHRMNPVVLLDHGWTSKVYPAVARADDDAGNYQVTLDAGKGRSVSRFSEKVADSYQTFALVAEGLLKGVSIGFRVLKAEYRKDHPDDYRGWPGLLIAQSELVEYSHCAIGVNPFALADKIGKGYLGGEKLTDSLWKSLAPLLPSLREQVPGGFESPGSQSGVHPATVEKSMAESQTQTVAPTPEQQDKPEPKPVEKSEKSEKPIENTPPRKKADGMNETTGSDGGQTVPQEEKPQEKPEDKGDDPTDGWLPGAKALAGCHGLLMAVGDFVEGAYGEQENERVTASLDEVADGVLGLAGGVETCFGECYPDYQLPGKSEDAEDAEDGESADGEGDDEGHREPDGDEASKGRLSAAGRALAAKLRLRAESMRRSALVQALADARATADEALRAENERLRKSLEATTKNLEELQKMVRRMRTRR